MKDNKKKKNLKDIQGMPFDEAMARMIGTPPPEKKQRKKHTKRKKFK